MLNKPAKDKKPTKSKQAKRDDGAQKPAMSDAQQVSPSGLPLFFKQPQALDKARHADAGIRPLENYDFAKEANSIPLNAIEFIEAVKSFPIVFTPGDQPAPVAVLGLKKENYFVGKDGKWQERSYIPAYVRQYPFVFFEQPEEDKFYLCVDEASSAFVAKAQDKQQALFDNKGEPTAATQNALDFCTAFYNHHKITDNFCADLKTHELLVPYQSEAQLASGEKLNLAGFLMIDEPRFNALPDEVVVEFKQKGWLAFIYLALASASNWKHLFELANSTNEKPATHSKIKSV